MTDWIEYTAAWSFFLSTHACPVRAPVRPWLVARLGSFGFGLAYSALSLVALAWLVGAAGRAPFILLWPQPAGAHWLVLAATALSAVLLSLSLGRPNPFSFGGAHNHLFNPQRPGLVRSWRHPVLLALMIWALSHLAVNGDLAHALLFGGFAGFAVLGMRLLDRRRQREMGLQHWHALLDQTRAATLVPKPHVADGLRLMAGAAALLTIIFLHGWLSGVEIWTRFMP